MKKQFKRFLASLLVIVMVLAMLPTLAIAAEGYAATPLTEFPAADQTVVIYSKSAGAVFAGTADGGTIGMSSAAVSEESADITVGEGGGVYKIVPAGDGTYYITCGTKYLCVSNDEQLSLADSAISGTKWNLREAKGDDYDGYTISNAQSKYNGKEIYIEYYSGFKAWTCSTVSAIYVFNFYAIDGAAADPNGDGYIGVKPDSGILPEDGDTIVIYNDYGKACFAEQSDDPTAPSLNAVDSRMTDDGIEAGNGALIFTVHKSGQYYTFENQGRYLRTSPNEGTSNAECLYFDTAENEYTQWTLEKCTGGYIIYNKTAKYKSSKVCIEYFGSSFSGWTFNGSTNLFAMRFYKVEDPNGLGYVLNPKVNLTAENAFLGADYEFEAKLDELTEVKSVEATYSVDGGAAKAVEATTVDGYKYSYVIPNAELAGGAALTLKVTATNEYDMVYSGEKTVEIKDEPLILSVSPASNEATGSEKRPVITVNIANCGENPTIKMTLDGNTVTPTVAADKITYQSAANMTDDRHAVNVVITRADGKQVSMEWSFFVGEAGISLYFGQMHSHTAEYSDGAGQLEDAYEYAMKADDVDFLFVTDHSNYFDTTSTATTSSYYDLSSLTKIGDTTKWEEAKATAAEYNAKSDDFVAAYGYEMTWSGGPGHTNSYNTYGTISRNNGEINNKTGYAGMHRYNDLMVNADRGLDIDGNPVAEGVKTKYIDDAPVVSQFNHPGTTFGNFDNFAGYTPSRDSVLSLVEVGNGEGQVGGSSYWTMIAEYDLALAKGWHVAPTNNQDNHKGKWGDANTCRDVVVTDDFTEAGLYRAMSERRVYATEDQNLRIYYYLNDELMGSIIDTTNSVVEDVNITASISDPDGEKLGKIEVIGENGMTLATYDAPGATYELKATLPNTDAYYYLKITQADGDIAVTAPVWLGVATPITAAIDTDAALSVVGETETITASVTNAAEYDFELEKVELSLIRNGSELVVKTIEEPTTVAVDKTKTYTIDYVRSLAGEQTLKVVFTGTYNGKEFQCQASMDQKVYKASELVKIGIDYGHGNFYVSGGYSDNMGNFIQYCADNGIMASFIQAGELTYDNIKNLKMLALTVPFDSGKLDPSVYTAEELAALQKYADNGGNLIVTTKSDRKSPTDELNCAAVTNSILEAVGSNVRAANGIIVDNELKSNEAYRIYFSSKENFNLEHRFTAGVYTSSNAFGTVPATDNQTGFQLYNAGPILINEGAEDKVTVLVKGYQSTWGASYTDNFDGSAYVPDYNTDTVTAEMGDVNIMTYEELQGGGWLITSGCTFFSNYDIKDDQGYANKYIVKNILQELTGSNTDITPIQEVKKETKVGTEYTVEGYITSNASGYDQDTAFFDCIYIEDKDGNGINIFPVAGNYFIGMKVRIHGGIVFYCGEVELNTSPDYSGYLSIISDNFYEIEPKQVDCATAMADETIGNLMQVSGIVTDIHKTEGVIDKIYVRDDSGTACLFINGYIMKDYTGIDELKIGMKVTGVGIGSRDVDETSATNAIFSRLRVRDRSEIKITDSTVRLEEIYTDVIPDEWYMEAVAFAVESGLLKGTSEDKFSPDVTLTRATVATVLYRQAGEPSVNGESTFSDVEDGIWYTNAIIWAQENGIVNGYENGTFQPDRKVTRQEMAVMLARYAKSVGVDTTPAGDLSAFADGDTVAAWAVNEMTWCVDNGIISGVSTSKIAPQNNATRAQFAMIVMRFVNLQNAE